MLSLLLEWASGHIVHSDQATIGPMVRPAFFAASNGTNVLIVIPHIGTANRTTISLNEDATELKPVAVAVAIGVRTVAN